MSSRTTLAVDRTVIIVVGLVLLVGGLALGWWWSGYSPFPSTLRTTGARDLIAMSWWGAASALVGLLLILLGLRWLLAHLTSQGVGRLHLAGSGAAGRLDVAASKVAGAAADALADTIGVRSARGRVVRDRGQMVARLSAVVEPECDLALVARRSDLVSGQLRQALERDDLRCSVELRVAATSRRLPRVG